MPEVYDQFVEIATRLENHYKDMQDMEFTIEDGKLYMLQTRNGERTAAAALKIAVDLVDEGMIRYSPNRAFSPVAGLRVKATPVPLLLPLLPNTMACTLTAVPQS